jgi:hypothetical protein
MILALQQENTYLHFCLKILPFKSQRRRVYSWPGGGVPSPEYEALISLRSKRVRCKPAEAGVIFYMKETGNEKIFRRPVAAGMVIALIFRAETLILLMT